MKWDQDHQNDRIAIIADHCTVLTQDCTLYRNDRGNSGRRHGQEDPGGWNGNHLAGKYIMPPQHPTEKSCKHAIRRTGHFVTAWIWLGPWCLHPCVVFHTPAPPSSLAEWSEMLHIKAVSIAARLVRQASSKLSSLTRNRSPILQNVDMFIRAP